MTKRWSSTASGDGRTKRQASKRTRGENLETVKRELGEYFDFGEGVTDENVLDLLESMLEP